MMKDPILAPLPCTDKGRLVVPDKDERFYVQPPRQRGMNRFDWKIRSIRNGSPSGTSVIWSFWSNKTQCEIYIKRLEHLRDSAKWGVSDATLKGLSKTFAENLAKEYDNG